MTQGNTVHYRLIKDGYISSKCKGTWLKADIMLRDDLTLTEKVIVSMVLGFQKGDKDCFISDSFVGDWCSCTRSTANKIINSMVQRKILRKRYKKVNGIMKRVLWI